MFLLYDIELRSLVAPLATMHVDLWPDLSLPDTYIPEGNLEALSELQGKAQECVVEIYCPTTPSPMTTWHAAATQALPSECCPTQLAPAASSSLTQLHRTPPMMKAL